MLKYFSSCVCNVMFMRFGVLCIYIKCYIAARAALAHNVAPTFFHFACGVQEKFKARIFVFGLIQHVLPSYYEINVVHTSCVTKQTLMPDSK